MKKAIYFCTLAAAMLLAACSNYEETVEELQLGEPVKAQFTISFPLGASTRQSAAIVQEGAQTSSSTDLTKFRGIDKIKLFPSAVASGSFTTSSTIGSPINLTQMLKPTQQTVLNYIDDQGLVANSNSVLYGDVQLASGTQTFLFYGKAIDGNANNVIDEPAEYFKYGTLTPSASFLGTPTNVSAFTFTPVAITEANKCDTKREDILLYLNSITAVSGWSATGYNAGLESLYTKFTGMKAGSSANLQAAVEDLYNAVKDNGHTVAQAIKSAINNSTYVTITDHPSTNTSTVNFKDIIKGYPSASTDDNLPDGATVLSYNSTSKEFSYVSSGNIGSPFNVADITNYVYPANLYYWVKSGIKVSKASQAANYDGNKNWTTITNGYTDGSIIDAYTRSVALLEPVQYGVGRLDIKVVGNTSTLDDNGATLSPEGTTNLVNLSGIKLTGILIGGQKAVDWEFKPISTATEYTIYDNIVVSQELTATGTDVPGISIQTGDATSSSVPYLNHTLVLETAGAHTIDTGTPANSTYESVNVALEFINDASDFWGKDGIVPKGTKFYLVGKLDVKDVSDTEKQKTDYKVFKQDFKTIALFTISDLKKAENTIPDLRNPAIELGLSVNLEWQQGITFTQTF